MDTTDSDGVPVVIGAPLYDPQRRYVPGSSFDYTCHTCDRQLAVAPSSLRHIKRMGSGHVFWFFCPWCVDQLARMANEHGHRMNVQQVPGSDRDMRAAGLDADADRTVREAERLRRLFGTA